MEQMQRWGLGEGRNRKYAQPVTGKINDSVGKARERGGDEAEERRNRISLKSKEPMRKAKIEIEIGDMRLDGCHRRSENADKTGDVEGKAECMFSQGVTTYGKENRSS
ncbi:hypothetical protein PIB30_004963 [Stylosanthes scabra]|uniref:Uncharacterized protein n=1 Tax=Stylosanthes scabra TaxID=79078 RepID=A0ABU6X179_9FABA|nr:hypothetical protein [Stylosanthes scabra]